MKRSIGLELVIGLSLIAITLGCTPAQAQTSQPQPVKVQSVAKVQGTVGNRLFGQDRFQTAKAISEQVNSGMATDVILTSGNNFPDALSASVLAKKLNAPILLVDNKVQNSSEALTYIYTHLRVDGAIHIIGGEGIIGQDFIAQLNQSGYKNIDRIGGHDRYDTDNLIAQKLDVAKNTPVVIASGENFPDALSISSIASSKGYPILLVNQNEMAQDIKDFITNDQPSQVYIVGGVGVVSEGLKAEVQSLAPSTSITRLSGQDRFETAGQILKTFSLNPKTIYLASGNNFPDALAGSALASIKGDPIVLIDSTASTVPPAIESYLKQLHDANVKPEVKTLGGTGVVSDAVVQNVEDILNGVQLTPIQQLAQDTGMKLDSSDTYRYYDANGDVLDVQSRTLSSQNGMIRIRAWNTDGIKSTAWHVFQFYLPTEYETLYRMTDEAFHGSNDYFNTYSLDNKSVQLKADENSNTLYILIN